MNTETKFTWNDLVEAINKLPEEKRSEQVFISIDDESYFKKVAGLETISADIYVNKHDDEDCADLETLKFAHGDNFKIDDYKLSTTDGTPYLYNDWKVNFLSK